MSHSLHVNGGRGGMLGGGPSFGAGGPGGGLGGGQGIGDDVFEDADVFEEAATSLLGQAAEGLGAVLLEPLADLDESGLVEDLEVPAEIAVGQGAEFLEVGE